jgi:hypothetical protein
MNMPSNGRVIRKNNMVANNTVMSNMDIGHKQIITAYAGLPVALHCASMHTNALTENIVIANDESGWLALVFKVRCCIAYGGKLEDFIIATQLGRAF